MSKFIKILAGVALTGFLASCGASDATLFRIYEKGAAGAPGKFGYVDAAGKTVVKPAYDQADDFAEGLAVVQADNHKFGFINTSGSMVVKADYDRAGKFSEGLAWVVTDGKTGYVAKDGKLVVPATYEQGKDFKEGFAAVSQGGKYGFIDKTGKVLVEPKYKFASDFSEGLALVVDDAGKAGYIDAKANVVIAPAYKYAGPFKEGLALVMNEDSGKRNTFFITKEGKKAFEKVVGKDGKEVAVELFADNFSEGLALFVIRDPANPNTQLGGFANAKGEVVIEPAYKLAKSFSEGLAVAEKGDKIGYINKKGEWMIEATYANADSFKNGLALAFNDKDKKLQYITKTGAVVWSIAQSDLPGNEPAPDVPAPSAGPAPAHAPATTPTGK